MSDAVEPWPRLGLGCASLGAPSLDHHDAESVIAAAIERGIRFFDVAPLYGGGLAEERLGRALAASGLARDDYVLCTKTGVTRPYAQPPMPPGATRRREFDHWDYSAQATRVSVAKSLERLRTDRLDVVHLHDVENHLDTCLEAYGELSQLRAQGVIGGIGVGSNLVAPVESVLQSVRLDAFLLAGCYTLLDVSGRTLIEAAQSSGIRVIGGGVFNSGVLAAWPQPAPTFAYAPAPDDVLRRTGRIAAICTDHGVPLAAVALQFVLAHPGVSTVLLGPRTIDELELNLRAATVPIPDALWDELRAAGIIATDAPQPRGGALARVD